MEKGTTNCYGCLEFVRIVSFQSSMQPIKSTEKLKVFMAKLEKMTDLSISH